MKKKKKMAGVYELLNIKNNRRYVGSTNDTYQRKHNHYSMLKYGKHYNPELQGDYDLYGRDSFVFNILFSFSCKTNRQERYGKEQEYLDKFSVSKLYNVNSQAKGVSSEESKYGKEHHSWGKKHTEETRRKISEKMIGVFNGEKNPFYGKKHSLETKKKISQAKTGKKRNPATVARGEKMALSKLTGDSVLEIRKLWKSKEYKQRELGAMFGVHPSVISLVVNNKAWTHIK